MSLFGSSKAEVMYGWGGKRMRKLLYPYIQKHMRGELLPYEERALQASKERAAKSAAVLREEALRALGRYPGVSGPERSDVLRRITEQEVKTNAEIETALRQGNYERAAMLAMQYSKPVGIKQTQTSGFGPALAQLAGAAIGGAVGGPAGAAGVAGIGGAAGGVMSGKGGGSSISSLDEWRRAMGINPESLHAI